MDSFDKNTMEIIGIFNLFYIYFNMNIINALLVSLFASFSTCLGCVFLFAKIKSQNINKFITFSLSFSIAIMIGISIFDLLPSSIFIIINRYKIWSILLFSLLFLCSYYLIKYISNLLRNTMKCNNYIYHNYIGTRRE